MSVTDPDSQAFPGTYNVRDEVVYELGLSKREYFAGLALQGLLAGRTTNDSATLFASRAVELADQLIKKLDE
jgi:hypothetical protein